MNTLIVGRGWVGSKLHALIGGDTCSHNDVIDIITHLKPGKHYDWVINCAGVTGSPNVDHVDPYEAIVGNTVFPIKLSQACDIGGVRLMHFSSGCIYQGEIDDVNATPNYTASAYSLSKAVSDVELRDKAVVVRIRMPFDGTLAKKNLLTKLHGYAKTGRLVDLGMNSLSDIDEMVEHAANLIGSEDGAYNLVNTGAVSNRQIAEMMGLKAEWFADGEFINPRSSCTIPPSVKTENVQVALEKAIRSMLDTRNKIPV